MPFRRARIGGRGPHSTSLRAGPPHTGTFVAGDRNQRKLQALDGGQQLQNLFGFAARGKRDHDVASGQHSQIPVQGLDRMHEKRRRSCGAESGRNLSSDDAALAHAGYDDSSDAAVKQFDRSTKCLRHCIPNAVGEVL